MVPGRHAIETALDLSRIPALARNGGVPQIPPNVIDIIRIAAGSSKACEEAADATGESPEILVEVARFYLQQCLFRPEADSYRVLGLRPGASRATARTHMRLLMEWLHPDRNGELDSVYAERVLNAWREISSGGEIARRTLQPRPPSQGPKRGSAGVRLPWIEKPMQKRSGRTLRWVLLASLLLAVVLWVLYSAVIPVRWIAAFSSLP